MSYCMTFAPPEIETSFSPAAALARWSARSTPSVTKVKVVPPSLTSVSRALCVMTNTEVKRRNVSPRGLADVEHPPPHDERPRVSD